MLPRGPVALDMCKEMSTSISCSVLSELAIVSKRALNLLLTGLTIYDAFWASQLV